MRFQPPGVRPFADPGGNSGAGESYLVFGKATTTAVDLENLGSGGFRIDGIDAGDNSGWSVSGAGDVNGDGLADLIIGAHRADPGGDSEAGESYLVFGGNFTASITQHGGTDKDLLTGTTAADQLLGAQNDDTLIGGGGADVLYAGIGDDLITIGDAGFNRIAGGSDSDTLRLDAAFNLDLTTIADNRISGIEIINLNGNNNGLTLNHFDVKKLSDATSGGLTRLIVDGVAGNSTTAPGSWISGGTTVIGSETYNIWTLAGAELLVDVDISQAITS